MSDLFDSYPYAERFGVNRELPDSGRSGEEILGELRTMATEEDRVWETGRCSGTMYCGDRDHYAFLKEAFGLFAHQNALQRDMCPSATRFEGEIIAMALDLMHAGAVDDGEPAGMVTSGGSASIAQAMLAYREHGRDERGIDRPNVVKPETGHPAFDKACHLFGIELRRVPVDPETTLVRPGDLAEAIDERTVAIVGSAGNYGYGTIDPISELAELAIDRGTGMHVDGCLGGYLLPFGEELGLDIPQFDFRVPGVTSISADTHKYGYGLKGTSTLLFRDKALRNACYFFMPEWSGGKYFSPDGGLALRRAACRHLGIDGLTRARGLSPLREGHLRDLGGDAGEGASPSRAADPRRADLPVRLHLGGVRHLPRERRDEAARLAVQRAPVPERPAHGGHPAADPARGRRCVRERSGRGGRVRARARRSARRVRRFTAASRAASMSRRTR